MPKLYHYLVHVDPDGDVAFVQRFTDERAALTKFSAIEEQDLFDDDGWTAYLLGSDRFGTLLITHGNIFGVKPHYMDIPGVRELYIPLEDDPEDGGF
jgi:hypothetical protein